MLCPAMCQAHAPMMTHPLLPPEGRPSAHSQERRQIRRDGFGAGRWTCFHVAQREPAPWPIRTRRVLNQAGAPVWTSVPPPRRWRPGWRFWARHLHRRRLRRVPSGWPWRPLRRLQQGMLRSKGPYRGFDSACPAGSASQIVRRPVSWRSVPRPVSRWAMPLYGPQAGWSRIVGTGIVQQEPQTRRSLRCFRSPHPWARSDRRPLPIELPFEPIARCVAQTQASSRRKPERMLDPPWQGEKSGTKQAGS